MRFTYKAEPGSPSKAPAASLSAFVDLFRRPEGLSAVALIGIFTILFFYTLSYTRGFILPVIVAWLLSFMLRPVIRALVQLSLPKPVAAAIVMAVLLSLAGSAIVGLYGPAMNWVTNAPKNLQKAELKIRRLLEPAAQMTQAMEKVQKMTAVKDEDATQVEVKQVSLAEVVFNWTKSFLLGVMVTCVLLFFLLATGDIFLKKLVKLLPRPEDKQRVVDISRETEEKISTYLFTIAVINGSVGTTVGIAMYLLGLPNPVLWGVMVGFFKFIPYIGEIFSLTVIALVSFVQFNTLGQAAVPPLVFLAITSLEANLITPMILGRRLTLNPVFIFISLVFWGWLWGVPGAMIAVPLLMTLKILCDQIPSLQPFGEFLGS